MKTDNERPSGVVESSCFVSFCSILPAMTLLPWRISGIVNGSHSRSQCIAVVNRLRGAIFVDEGDVGIRSFLSRRCADNGYDD